MKKIILTGGGTAGHVIPNLALIPSLKAADFDIYYIGSHNGIERDLVESSGIPYFGISSGKLRRYASIKNATDIFRVGKGLIDAIRIIRKIKPDIIFSKGGFVVVPVIMAAKLLRIKSVIHESDMTPGLANKIAMPFAAKVCVSFPETLAHIPKQKGIYTGSPIRSEISAADSSAGLRHVGFGSNGLPILLVTGGSQGSKAINATVREVLPKLLTRFRVAHLCGKGNLSGITLPGYAEFEYIDKGMADVLSIADIVVSRAGANTLFELTALGKPNLLIPLPASSSRGDQILNAASFEKQGFSMVLPEENMTADRLLTDIYNLYDNRDIYVAKMPSKDTAGGTQKVMDAILQTT